MGKLYVLTPFGSVGAGLQTQNTKWFATDIPVINQAAEKLRISVTTTDASKKVEYTRNGGSNWVALNGNNVLTASAIYSESIDVAVGDQFNLRTPTAGGITLTYATVNQTGADVFTRTIGQLTDVGIAGSVDQQVLTFNSGGGTWINKYTSPYVYAKTSQKSETQTADANVLTYTPPASAGTYRCHVTASVSSATSGVISFTLDWTDSNGNAQSAKTIPLFQVGTAAPNTTFTTSSASNYSGVLVFDINNAAANIIVKWVGGGTTAAKVSATIEELI